MTKEEAIKVLMYDVSLIISHTIDGTHEKIEQATKCNEALVLGVDALKNRKTGRWMNNKCRDGCYLPCCSACGESSGTYYEYNYCPNCGAEMGVEE